MRRNLHHGRMMGSMGIVVLVVLAAFMFLGLMQTSASAESVITLTGETWVPTMSVPAKVIGPEYPKALEQATGGMVKTDWYTASALGAVPELYTRLIQGIIDWGHFNIGYTPGVFPMMEMFELPMRITSEELFTKAYDGDLEKGLLR